MFAHIRAAGLTFRTFAMTVAPVAAALILTLILAQPAAAAAPAQHQGPGMGGDMAGMGMMAATQPISGSMNMAEMGAQMVAMGQMMTTMGEMMSSMPMTGTMSMDDMDKMMGMMGMMGQMHMQMGQMQTMLAGGMMAGDMGMMGKCMGMMDDMMAGGMMGGSMMCEGMMGGGMGVMGGDKADVAPAPPVDHSGPTAPAAVATPTVTVTVPVSATTPAPTAAVPTPATTPEPAAAAPVDHSGHAAPTMVHTVQKAVAGAITVEVTPLTTGDVLDVAFAVALDTHSVDLGFDLAERATLTIGTAKFAATAWEPETTGGHHVPGVLRFVIDHPAHAQLYEVGEVTLELHDIDGQHVTLNFPLGAD